MSDSFKVNVRGLRRIGTNLSNGALTKRIQDLPKEKGIAGEVALAIRDNFDKEGPGWAPLKGSTLRKTVLKGQLQAAQRLAAYDMGASRKTKTGTAVNRKKLKGRMAEFNERTGKYLERDERQARKVGAEVGRHILQLTGFLKKCATTPGASGKTKSGQAGANIYRVEGTTLIWGVDLIYARAMNRGLPERNVPARPFLVIRDEWMTRIRMYYIDLVIRTIRDFRGRV